MEPTPTDWTAAFAGLTLLAEEDRSRLRRAAQTVELQPGTEVFRPGSPCTAYLLVLEGGVGVRMTSDTGREILLYRVGPGESCVLTTACLLGAELYAATGTVERPTLAVALPIGVFSELLGRSEPFRRFVFQGFGRRLADILATVEDAVFHRLDGRLARLLLDRARHGPVAATHQDIAAELGTAREVVSRQLKAFQTAGLVERRRSEVRILDRRRLQAVAERLD